MNLLREFYTRMRLPNIDMLKSAQDLRMVFMLVVVPPVISFIISEKEVSQKYDSRRYSKAR